MLPIKRQRIRLILFVSYCLFILWSTVFSRTPTTRQCEWRLMWAYREMLEGHPTWKEDVLQNVENILFFMPYGVLFPVKHKKGNWKKVLFTALAFSALIEFIQYIGALGLCELDDVICNTLGAVVGYLVCKAICHRVE